MIQAGADVWRIPLARPPGEVAALHALLDPAEQSRARMFRAERDRRRFVVARATLRALLAEYSGAEPRSVRFIVRPGGKPVVACDAMTGALHFNLSHCGDLALCAISSREVGVDLEQLKRHEDIERVARHFFSGEEARTLGTLSGIERTLFFFRTWVRKEAYLKATGEGLARDTTSFTVREPGTGVTLHGADGGHRTDDSYGVYDLPDIDDHFAALALAGAGTAAAIQYREWQT